MRFKGEYWFLSNFYPVDIEMDGVTYKTAEAAFQAQKCINPEERMLIASTDSGRKAKLLGRKVSIRNDWEDVKVDVMREVIDRKFDRPELAAMLVAVGGEIVEDNHWNDTFWGRCNGRGENWLGVLLMEKRDSLLEGLGVTADDGPAS